MPQVVITGANRGIGLEFVRQYRQAGWDVIATARRSSPGLEAVGARVEPLDLADADEVAAFPTRIDGSLDLLIANAGTNHPMNGETADEAREWQAMMMVNVIAPYMLGKALLAKIAEARGKMVAISSGMGSIAETSGGWLPYRTSKAALNMAWRSLALEARPLGASALLISPGWVKTRMGGSGAQITSEQSVGDMRRLIESLTPDQSGRFVRRNGSEIPW